MPFLVESSNCDSFVGVVATVVATVVPNEYIINFHSKNILQTCFLTYRDNGDNFTITGLSLAMEFCRESVVFKPTLMAFELLKLRELLAVKLFNNFNN